MAIDLTDTKILWEIQSLHKNVVNQNKEIIALLKAIKELLESSEEPSQ